MAFQRITRTAPAPAPAPQAGSETTEPTPGRLTRRRTSAAVGASPETEERRTRTTTTALQPATAALTLPALDAPCVNANEPAVSYKIDFSDRSCWFASTDGGETKTRTGSDTVAGMPIDLALQISKATGRPGFDQRLRLAFNQPDGSELILAELNCNAVNTDRDGNLYVTSPARSLAGSLLAISDSEEDMEAFCHGARFRLRRGTGKGVFIEVDVAHGDRWIAMASPANTNRIAKDAHGFHGQLALIKSRFRSIGQMLTAAAVIGELDAYDSEQREQGFVAVPVDVSPIAE